MRRKIAISAVLAVLVSSLAAGTTFAGKPSHGCPSTQSAEKGSRTWFIVNVDGWWVRTVDGFDAEFAYQQLGFTVYEGGGHSGPFTDQFDQFAADIGFGDGAGLEYFVKVTQWAVIDLNDNGWVCMKERPHTPGNPYYYFNGVDDQASTPYGETA